MDKFLVDRQYKPHTLEALACCSRGGACGDKHVIEDFNAKSMVASIHETDPILLTERLATLKNYPICIAIDSGVAPSISNSCFAWGPFGAFRGRNDHLSCIRRSFELRKY